jgi:hypothetical protein
MSAASCTSLQAMEARLQQHAAAASQSEAQQAPAAAAADDLVRLLPCQQRRSRHAAQNQLGKAHPLLRYLQRRPYAAQRPMARHEGARRVPDFAVLVLVRLLPVAYRRCALGYSCAGLLPLMGVPS